MVSYSSYYYQEKAASAVPNEYGNDSNIKKHQHRLRIVHSKMLYLVKTQVTSDKLEALQMSLYRRMLTTEHKTNAEVLHKVTRKDQW